MSFSFQALQASKRAIESLKKGTLDIAFGAKYDDPEINYFKIFSEQMFVVASMESNYSDKERFDLHAFESETFVTYTHDCGSRQFIEHLFARKGIAPKKVMEMETEKMIASAVSSNLGIALIPAIPEIQYYNLKILPTEEIIMRPIYMMWRNDKDLTPAIKIFIRFIQEENEEILMTK